MSSTPRVSIYRMPPFGNPSSAPSSASRTARPVLRVTINLPPKSPPATSKTRCARSSITGAVLTVVSEIIYKDCTCHPWISQRHIGAYFAFTRKIFLVGYGAAKRGRRCLENRGRYGNSYGFRRRLRGLIRSAKRGNRGRGRRSLRRGRVRLRARSHRSPRRPSRARGGGHRYRWWYVQRTRDYERASRAHRRLRRRSRLGLLRRGGGIR